MCFLLPNSLRHIVCVWLLLFTLGAHAVDKPYGIFSSAGAANDQIYENPQLRGVLIRVTWAQLEPTPGNYDFSALDLQVAKVESYGKQWSLASPAGGVGTPDWLMDELGADYIDYSFRGVPGYRLPLIWDPVVQARLKQLAEALAERYNDSESLKLVYVSQMTSNGLEGHLQGVNMTTMSNAGYSDEKWVEASIANARNFALAFTNKALAFEVHDINGSHEPPMEILDALWSDPELEQRVGAAVWWVSGKDSYQADLLAALADYPGDIYGQVIGNSGQPERFSNEDYLSALAQTKALGMRYLEPWDYEFRYSMLSANGAWDEDFARYNAWSEAVFVSERPALNVTIQDGEILLAWNAREGLRYRVDRSLNLSSWDEVAQLTPELDGAQQVILDGLATAENRQFYRVVLID
ncbi:beta-galactosidase [Cerasicoccus maritimus]|uniref:beta-galactosidase n=1 Tax=Cerasicoccus maritimus TaxID=490089 RepID=UPI002852D414|nr:beta-galactosidase [Cerasicoccus maritimus]